jgi:hypothetical protein
MTGIGPSQLDKRSASFETSLREASQDEEICHAIDDIPHPKEAAKQLSRRVVQPAAPRFFRTLGLPLDENIS